MIPKSIQKICLFITTFVVCMQFSTQKSSVNGKEKPSTNVYGTLLDANNMSFNVENITISGRFNDIEMYQKPSSPDINPEVNKIKIDLCTIKEIRVDTPKIMQFNKRDYVELVIITNNQNPTQNSYIIEKSKVLFCDYATQRKELSFVAVRRLHILGCKKQEEHTSCPPCQPVTCPASDIVKKQEIDATLTKTQSLLNQLEQNATQLQTTEQEGTLKAQLLQVIHDLKTTIQDTIKKWFA